MAPKKILKVSTANTYSYLIECLEEYHYNYIQLKNNPKEEINKIFYSYYYLQQCSILPKHLNKQIIEPLQSIYQTACQRRKEASEIFRQNPYVAQWKVSYYYWKSYTSWFFYSSRQSSAAVNPNRSCCFQFWYVWASIRFGLLWAGLYLWIALLFLGDLLCGRLDSTCHGEERARKEQEWLATTTREHPHLEDTAIQKYLLTEIEGLQQRCNEKYPKAKFHFLIRLKRIESAQCHVVTVKQFIFKITRPDHPTIESRLPSMAESKFELQFYEENEDLTEVQF